MQSIGSVGDGQGKRRLRTKAAAIYIGISESTLEKARVTGDLGIPFLKIGKSVLYDTSDLDAWLTAHRRLSTSDQPQAA